MDFENIEGETEKIEHESENIDETAIIQRKIKHLVISGGSIWGLSAFGIIYEAICSGFLNIDDIESIYSTSIGAVVGLSVALKIDHNILKDYFINRPWEQVCKKSVCSVLEAVDNKGFINKMFFIELFSPLLKSVDLNLNITMQQLYDYNKIDFHIYVTELNSFTLLDISYKTHPDWLVVDAIYASCSIPIIFTPIVEDDNCYVDGGFFLNYPISKCIENVTNLDEILGISLGNNNNKINPPRSINEESNIFDLLNVLMNRLINNVDFFSNEKTIQIPYNIHFFSKETTIEYCLEVLYNKNDRQDLVYSGINAFKEKCKVWFI